MACAQSRNGISTGTVCTYSRSHGEKSAPGYPASKGGALQFFPERARHALGDGWRWIFLGAILCAVLGFFVTYLISCHTAKAALIREDFSALLPPGSGTVPSTFRGPSEE